MKDREKKHKKGSENTIGKIIYGFLLFMPLIAIVTASLISTFNMSGKQESEIVYKYKSNEVTSIYSLRTGNIYKLDVENITDTLSTYQDILIASNVFLDGTEYNANINNTDISLLTITYNPNNTLIVVSLLVNNVWNRTLVNSNVNNIKELNFVFLSSNSNTINSIDLIHETEFNVIDHIELNNLDAQDVFYNAIDKVQESTLFNWAENSIIYTTTNATCNALSITTPFVPLLLSYWLIISIMYFLYDIALMLIWVLHDRIHALKDSIT